jgi:hypothetical protein
MGALPSQLGQSSAAAFGSHELRSWQAFRLGRFQFTMSFWSVQHCGIVRCRQRHSWRPGCILTLHQISIVIKLLPRSPPFESHSAQTSSSPTIRIGDHEETQAQVTLCQTTTTSTMSLIQVDGDSYITGMHRSPAAMRSPQHRT